MLVRNTLIALILLMLIVAPRPAAGYLDLMRARRSKVAGDYATAASAFVSAAQRLPWRPSVWEEAAYAYLNGSNYDQAESVFAAAIRRHALSPVGYMYWGYTRFVLGDPKAALKIWNGLIDTGIDQSALWSFIARGYQALALYPDEIQARQKYLGYQPGDAAEHYRLGLLLAATSPAEALPELVQAAQIDPSLDAPVQGLRTALNIALNSDDPAYRLLFTGRALGALGDWDLAAEAFRNAIAARPVYAEAWAWFAEAKQQQGQDGKIEIDQALALDPDSAMVQSLHGLYLQRQKQPVQALAAFQIAALLEPQDPGWQMALGRAYEQTDDLVAALEHYQRAVALVPEQASAWRALAEFSLRDNVDLTGVGLPAARRLVELANDDWQSLDIAGQIILETGDLLGAEALLKKALELGPAQAAPALHLGLLYLQTGDRPAAFSQLNQAKLFDPDGPYGWQAKRLLEQYFP